MNNNKKNNNTSAWVLGNCDGHFTQFYRQNNELKNSQQMKKSLFSALVVFGFYRYESYEKYHFKEMEEKVHIGLINNEFKCWLLYLCCL